MCAQLKGKASTRLFLVIMRMCRKRNALESTIYEKYIWANLKQQALAALSKRTANFANYKQEEFVAD
jgi:hypothetical protein